jgi:hypothetical protein
MISEQHYREAIEASDAALSIVNADRDRLRLVDLMYDAGSALGEIAATFLERMNESSDIVPIMFIMGMYSDLWEMVRVDDELLGWTSSKKGQAFPLLVVVLLGNHTLQSCVRTAIKRIIYENDKSSEFIEIISKQRRELPHKDREILHQWCVDEVEKRVEAIVLCDILYA